MSIGEALKEIVTSIPDSPCDEHICPFCETVVPKKRLVVLGMEKIVQPVCHCEVAHDEKERQEAIDRKKRNDIESKFSVAKMGERFQESTFATFQNRSGSEKAESMAKDYAASFPAYNPNGLMLWGGVGGGKSHLAAAICHEIKAKGFIPVFQSVPALLERIRSTFNSRNKESEKEIMDALRDCDLLVLDDIGAEKISDWVMDVLFRIIDGRYNNKKPIVYTTNFNPDELLSRFMPEKPSKEDEIKASRIHDRIIETSIIVENKAASHRQEVAETRFRQLSEKEKQKRMWAE